MELVPELARKREVQRLLAGLTYRARLYVDAEMGLLRPWLCAYQGAAEWSPWDTDGKSQVQALLLASLMRLRTLLEVLRIGWVMAGVSYQPETASQVAPASRAVRTDPAPLHTCGDTRSSAGTLEGIRASAPLCVHRVQGHSFHRNWSAGL
jgi:hypothetical protein